MGLTIKFIKNFVLPIIIIILGIFIYARFIEPNLLVVKSLNITSNTNYNSNIRVVFFSDTHFGNMYDENKLEDIVDKINNLNADLVVFGGDLIDSYYKFPPDTSYIQSKLKQINASIGKYSIYGNHDYGGGAEKVFKEIMKNSDFTILENEIEVLSKWNIKLIGLDDYLLGNPDKSIVDNIDKNSYNILISHAPDIIDAMNMNNVNFTISGHTHGGQVTVPILTKKFLPPGGKKYVKGFFDITNNSKLYVTSGIGLTKVNFRFLNIPEILVFDIKY